MEIKFYGKVEIEEKGFEKFGDVLWLKKGMGGKTSFLKCNGCKRFFEGGTISNEAIWVESQCPFCAIKFRIPINK